MEPEEVIDAVIEELNTHPVFAKWWESMTGSEQQELIDDLITAVEEIE